MFKLSERGGSSPLVNMINLAIRILQVIFSATVIGIYATQVNDDWLHGIHGKLILAETVGAMSLVTAVIFGVIPFLISYHYVAIALIWDWILFFIWCAVFATQHKFFGNSLDNAIYKEQGYPGVGLMVAAQWIDLTAMLLFLVSAIMGPVCLLMDRRSLFASRAVA